MKHFPFSSFSIFGLKRAYFTKWIKRLKKKSHVFFMVLLVSLCMLLTDFLAFRRALCSAKSAGTNCKQLLTNTSEFRKWEWRRPGVAQPLEKATAQLRALCCLSLARASSLRATSRQAHSTQTCKTSPPAKPARFLLNFHAIGKDNLFFPWVSPVFRRCLSWGSSALPSTTPLNCP